jgi:hypothetical protein
LKLKIMLKGISNLGTVLNKSDQKIINEWAGRGRSCPPCKVTQYCHSASTCVYNQHPGTVGNSSGGR